MPFIPDFRELTRRGQAALALALALSAATVEPAESATYTWNGPPGTGTWTNSAHWSPARNSPAASDVLIIDGSATPFVTILGVVSETIGRLVITNAANVMLQGPNPGPVTLTISGDGGPTPDLEVQSGVSLTIPPPGPVLSLATDATGEVSGSINSASQLLAVDVGALVFEAGALLTASGGGVHVFGATNLNSVVFESGSTFRSLGGNHPFGAAAPASVVEFHTGSLYQHSSGSLSLGGRTVSNFEFIGGNTTTTDPGVFTADGIEASAGIQRLRIAEIHVRGDLVANGGDLLFDASSPQVVHLDGSAPQLVSGDVTVGSNCLLVIENSAGVSHSSSVQVQGGVVLDGGHLTIAGAMLSFSASGALQLLDGIVHTGVNTVHLNTGTSVVGGSDASHVNGRVRHVVAASGSQSVKVFPVGDGSTYAPVTISLPSVSTAGSIVVTTAAGDHAEIATSGLDASKTVNRTWTVTNTSTVFAPCAVTFGFAASDFDPSTPTGGLVVRKFDAPSTWSTTVTGTRTPTSTQATGIASFSEFQIGLGPPEFVDIGAGLLGVLGGGVVWGDYDNDGDLDILLSGDAGGSGLISHVIRNDSGVFTEIGAGLVGVSNSSMAWGDYDNDGDLDVLLAGSYAFGATVSLVYRNDSGAFVDIGAGLPGTQNGVAAWGDYDNDGDLDILLAGTMGSGGISAVYRNDDGAFVDIGAGLVGVEAASGAWGDCDDDGDLDILLTGSSSLGMLSRVYINENGTFTDLGAGLPGVWFGSTAWGDYDNDGDLDILLTGQVSTGLTEITRVYRNDAGDFTDIGAGLPGVWFGGAVWGDYDNDGDLDILLHGMEGYSSSFLRVYRNDAGTFSGVSTALPDAYLASVAWGDYDNDMDLDVLLTGETAGGAASRVYRNDSPVANTLPSAPANLQSERVGDRIVFDWDAASDTQTPAPGLNYNLRVGTTPGGNEISSAMSAADGYRRVPRLGNANGNTSWSLEVPQPVPPAIYWSVQSVDAAFAGSPFAAEQLHLSWDLVQAGLPNSSYGTSAEWGDWDNDGDLDLAITGEPAHQANVYRNGGGTFSLMDFTGVLPAVWGGTATWGDFDGDGVIDLAAAGMTSPYATATTFAGDIFRNEPGTHDLLVNANNDPFPPGAPGFAWTDFDNDGDIDLAMLIYASPVATLHVFRNDAGTFVDTGVQLPAGLARLTVADFDRDGDMDLLTTGPATALLYRNQGGEFTSVSSGLPPHAWSQWGDFDNDGWPDVAMGGPTAGVKFSVYRNKPVNPGDPDDPNRVFELYHQTAGAPSLGVITCGDYDNDGRLDVFGTGSGHSELANLYHNDGGGLFSQVPTDLPGVSRGTCTWGDYDADGDLDLLFTGLDVNTDGWCRINRNPQPTPNTIPTAPTGLSAQFADATLTLSWNPATDAETPSPGLSYNIRVGTTPGGSELMAGMADPVTGYRRVVRLGNAGQRLSWSIKRDTWPDGGPLYFGVQAIDAAFAGSPWGTFAVTGVEEGSPPARHALHAPAPMPFRDATRISFDLPSSERVRLEVFDVAGRVVRTLRDEVLGPGRHSASWDGADRNGQRLQAGVYFVRMSAGAFRETRRAALLD